MSYATLEQLIERYGERLLIQLTDRATPPLGEIDPVVVARALAAADATIDGYLAGRYVLPLAEVPPLLPGYAQEIAIYKLHPFQPDAKIEKEYESAVAALVRIAAGTITLQLEGVAPASSGASGVETTDRERPFSPESLKGFI